MRTVAAEAATFAYTTPSSYRKRKRSFVDVIVGQRLLQLLALEDDDFLRK
jgi:hypothetical protein